MRVWYLCYHSSKYPVTTFVHLDDNTSELSEPGRRGSGPQPLANSTLYSASVGRGATLSDAADSVGHASHLPRAPPAPATYTVPSALSRSLPRERSDHLFGMVKLKDDDVCYTSGTIEWVGRKRNYPINGGFKVIADAHLDGAEPSFKKMKGLRESGGRNDRSKDCDCADVLPTVNAIVDHLNALHEAVDLVDLRLNTLEEFVGNN